MDSLDKKLCTVFFSLCTVLRHLINAVKLPCRKYIWTNTSILVYKSPFFPTPTFPLFFQSFFLLPLFADLLDERQYRIVFFFPITSKCKYLFAIYLHIFICHLYFTWIVLHVFVHFSLKISFLCHFSCKCAVYHWFESYLYI